MADGPGKSGTKELSKEKPTEDGAEGSQSPEDTDTQTEQSTQSTSEWLMAMMKRSLGLSGPEDLPEKVLPEVTLDGIIEYIKSGKCKRIVTMTGAGISTSAGIPDFRSPGTGLYDNLQKYNLPSPQAIFDISFFKENPEPFFQLAKELWPGTFKPTPCHYFIRLLDEHGLLLRHYTQNIDTLERVAGLNPEKIVEAHGTFHSSHCIECKTSYSQDWIKEKIFAEVVPHCEEEDCEGVIKPDIVFFGEALPSRFSLCVMEDLPECDLVVVMGTSLAVQPFASLTNRVPATTPRLLINLEKPSGSSDPMMALFGMGHGLDFDSENCYRDVFVQSTCDDGCKLFAEKMGWKEELEELIKTEHARIDEENPAAPLDKPDDKGSDANKGSAPKPVDAAPNL